MGCTAFNWRPEPLPRNCVLFAKNHGVARGSPLSSAGTITAHPTFARKTTPADAKVAELASTSRPVRKHKKHDKTKPPRKKKKKGLKHRNSDAQPQSSRRT